MENSDSITNQVQDMYKKYPYPSPATETAQTNELLNLLRVFELESKMKFDNKKFLDAGSGSGHRITNVASFFKNSKFLGIDISDTSLGIANKLKQTKNLSNLNFLKHNIMSGVDTLGKFDFILCMGVLHHLSNPKKGLKLLTKTLNENGMIFLYLYGKLGGHQRMLNKELIHILLNDQQSDYELGIKLARELELNKFDYGWNLDFKNIQEEDSLIVDSLLHANEFLYDSNDIHELFVNSGLYGYSIFGITETTRGLLFDTRSSTKSKLSMSQTNIAQLLKSEFPLLKYELLTLKQKSRILDLLYKPNGYTILGFTKTGFENLENERIKANFVKLD